MKTSSQRSDSPIAVGVAVAVAMFCSAPICAGNPQGDFGEATFVNGLSAPTAIVFLPDGDLLITQQSGELLHFDGNSTTTLATIPVCNLREMGLLGVAVHADFPTDRSIYLYRMLAMTCDEFDSTGRFNQVIRVQLAADDTVDLKKKRLSLQLKNTGGFDPTDNVTLQIYLGGTRASMTLSDKDNSKATQNPTTGTVGPVSGAG